MRLPGLNGDYSGALTAAMRTMHVPTRMGAEVGWIAGLTGIAQFTIEHGMQIRPGMTAAGRG